MHTTKQGFGLMVALAIALALAAPPAAHAQEKVRVSLFSWPGYAYWFIAREKNLAPDLELDISIIEDPYESYALMAAGQLDATSSTVEYGPIAAESGNPARLVTFANLSYGTDRIILGPGVASPADLKGKSVAVMEGGLSQIYMGIYLEQNGLSFDDVTYVNLIMDDAAAAMIGGQAAAGEFWEPFGSQVLANLEGSRAVATSMDPYWARTALLADGMYMSATFISERPDVAAKTLKAYYDAVAWWMKHPAEGNAIIAEALQFPLEDVVSVIGDTGGPREGGLHVYSLQDAARFMGALPGDPPHGQTNGQIAEHWKLTNDWWKKFGLVEKDHPMAAGVDTSVIQRVVEMSQ